MRFGPDRRAARDSGCPTGRGAHVPRGRAPRSTRSCSSARRSRSPTHHGWCSPGSSPRSSPPSRSGGGGWAPSARRRSATPTITTTATAGGGAQRVGDPRSGARRRLPRRRRSNRSDAATGGATVGARRARRERGRVDHRPRVARRAALGLLRGRRIRRRGLPQFSLSSRLVFLVVGPVIDLKLIAMQRGVFGTALHRWCSHRPASWSPPHRPPRSSDRCCCEPVGPRRASTLLVGRDGRDASRGPASSVNFLQQRMRWPLLAGGHRRRRSSACRRRRSVGTMPPATSDPGATRRSRVAPNVALAAVHRSVDRAGCRSRRPRWALSAVDRTDSYAGNGTLADGRRSPTDDTGAAPGARVRRPSLRRQRRMSLQGPGRSKLTGFVVNDDRLPGRVRPHPLHRRVLRCRCAARSRSRSCAGTTRPHPRTTPGSDAVVVWSEPARTVRPRW